MDLQINMIEQRWKTYGSLPALYLAVGFGIMRIVDRQSLEGLHIPYRLHISYSMGSQPGPSRGLRSVFWGEGCHGFFKVAIILVVLPLLLQIHLWKTDLSPG